MTVILAVQTSDGNFIMAGDRRRGLGRGQFVDIDSPKVTKRGGFIIGSSGVTITNYLLREHFPIPSRQEGESLEHYMFMTFRKSLLKFLREENFLEEGNLGTDKDNQNSESLIIYENKLFNLAIEKDMTHLIQLNGTFGIGSGGVAAASAFHALEGFNLDVEERIVRSIKAAFNVVQSTGGGIDILYG